MAGPIQLGDALRLAELAWTVWEYGWAEENNAGENYRAFGADVFALHTSLERLEGTIKRAQTSLLTVGNHTNDILVDDQQSFSEIIGDYRSTLTDCRRLIDDNRRYAQTTGPLLNIDWNMNVVPQVEHLRGRIQMHNTRIQNLLKPFEIDLINNFHGNLARGMMGIHTNVLDIKTAISTLLAEKYPGVARAIEQREEQRLCLLEIPDLLCYKLESEFQNHGLRHPPNLQDITDCFLVHFGRSTTLSPHIQDGTRCPPLFQYLALLKCQFLMSRIKASDEIKQPQRMSYWPGYIRALEENLSQQCARFQNELIPPVVSNIQDEAFSLWDTIEKQKTAPPQPTGPPHDFLLELSLAPESETMTWRTLQLYRQIGSEYRFRIIEEWGDTRQPKPEGPHVVDFDTRTAVLVPLYADPVDENGGPPPLELLLEHSHRAFRYVFLDLRSLLQFQRALTGFQVAESYMQNDTRTVFVRPRKEDSFQEHTTIQLWMPSIMQGRSQVARGAGYRSLSTDSQQSTTLTYSHTSRAQSFSSSQSGATASTASRSSASFEDSIAVRLGGSAATITDHGMIRTTPRKPLLVLFTRDMKSARRSIVAISIDGETKPNPERCQCLYNKKPCLITALEQGRGPSSTLHARRLSHSSRWNLLSFPARAPEWEGLLRISMLFTTVEGRLRFGGEPCRCKLVTELDVDACLLEGHPGLLGRVRTFYRRQMVMRQGGSDSRPALTTPT